MEIEGLFKAEWRLKGMNPEILLFRRDKNRKKIVDTIKDFRPFIYIEKKAKVFLQNNRKWVLEIEEVTKKTIDGHKVLKVTLLNPRLVYQLKQRFQTWEADILFPVRYLLENHATLTAGDYKKFYFDIETSTIKGFPQNDNPIEHVTAITYATNYSNHTVTLLLSPKGEDKCEEKENWTIHHFADEAMMLTTFLDEVRKINPDILTAWNIEFDMGYLVARMKHLHVNYNRFANIGGVRVSTDTRWGNSIDVFDKVVFDLLDGYKQIVMDELPSYSLDYVSGVELSRDDSEEDEGKEKMLDFTKSWREDTENFLKYAWKDVDLIKRLDKKVGIIDYVEEIKNLGLLTDINSAFFYSRVIDNRLLAEFKDDCVFINKGSGGPKVEIIGGHVFKPIRGLWNWVMVLDFSKMYPSIVETFNLSWDTVNIGDSDVVLHTDEQDPRVQDIGISFAHRGMLPQVLGGLTKWRNFYKDEMIKFEDGSVDYMENWNKQFAAKFLINAGAYGVMNNPYYRLYKPAVAAAITFIGRTLLKHAADSVKKKYGITTLYGDTDSIFIHTPEWKGVKLDDATEDEREELIKDMSKTMIKDINICLKEKVKEMMGDFYDEEHYDIWMETEKMFNKFLPVQKKKYAGDYYWKVENGKDTFYRDPYYKYVGIDIKRTNIPEIIRDALKQFVNDLFTDGDHITHLKEYAKEIKTSNDMTRFQTPLKIEKIYETNQPQTRAATYANNMWKLGFEVGSKFYGIYTKVSVLNTDVIGFDVPNRLTIKETSALDRKRYESILIDKVHLLYDVPHLKNVLNNQKQLGEFT